MDAEPDVTVTVNCAGNPKYRIENEVVDPNWTWTELLEDKGIHVDRNQYRLSCVGPGRVVDLDDKIANFVAQYKRRQVEYIVKLVSTTRGRKKGGQNLGAKVSPSRIVKAKAASRKSRPLMKKRAGLATLRTMKRNGDIIENEPSPRVLAPRMHFEEDNIRTPYADQRRPVSAAANNYMMDDSESMVSQDSQDDGEDIVSGIVDRLLKCVRNGDMQRIRNELRQVKSGDKFMRYSRHMPLTMNMLFNIFLD